MSVAVITGSAGLIGSEAARVFADLGYEICGIDNDMRSRFFGSDASTAWNRARLIGELGDRYVHHDTDIRDRDGLARIFASYGDAIGVVIHTAAQPSHDWANPSHRKNASRVRRRSLLQAGRHFRRFSASDKQRTTGPAG